MDNMPMLKQDDLSDLKAVSKKLREYERSNSVAALHYMGQSLIEELEAAREKIAVIEVERDGWKENHEQREREAHEDAITVRALADRTHNLESEAATLRRVGEELKSAAESAIDHLEHCGCDDMGVIRDGLTAAISAWSDARGGGE